MAGAIRALALFVRNIRGRRSKLVRHKVTGAALSSYARTSESREITAAEHGNTGKDIIRRNSVTYALRKHISLLAASKSSTEWNNRKHVYRVVVEVRERISRPRYLDGLLSMR